MFLTNEDMQKVTRILEHYEKEIDLTTTIPLEEYEARYEKVWKRMEEKGIDVGFFYWFCEMPGDGAYLTGYNPTLEKASGAIAPGKRPVLLVGPESALLAEEVGLHLETHFVDTFTIPGEYYEGVTGDSSHTVDLKARQFYATKFIDGKKMSDYHHFSSAHGTGLTECLEKQLIHPYREIYYGNNIGIMLDKGVYHYPHKDICGGCVESAFHKRGTGVVCLTDLPADVQELVGKGL